MGWEYRESGFTAFTGFNGFTRFKVFTLPGKVFSDGGLSRAIRY